MTTRVIFCVDEDVYSKFCLALTLTGEAQDKAAESCLRWYIANTFEQASHEYDPKKNSPEHNPIRTSTT